MAGAPESKVGATGSITALVVERSRRVESTMRGARSLRGLGEGETGGGDDESELGSKAAGKLGAVGNGGETVAASDIVEASRVTAEEVAADE